MSHYLLHPKQAADGTNEELLNSPSVSDRADAKDYNSPFCAKTTEYDPIKTGRAISALKTAAGSSDVDYLQLAKAIAGTIELLARISPKGGDIQAWAEANYVDLAQFVRSESRKHRRDSVVATRTAKVSMNDSYPASLSYKITGKHGNATTGTPADWVIGPDGTVSVRLGNVRINPQAKVTRSLEELEQAVQAHLSSQQEETLVPGSIRLGVERSVPDDVRQIITKSGWTKVPSKAEEERDQDARNRVWQDKMRTEKQVREGAQALDKNVPSNTAPVPTRRDVLAVHDGREFVGIRFKSVGYGATDDSKGMWPTDMVVKHGGEIIYDAPAVTAQDGFVGSLSGGGLREISYILGGVHRYMYIVSLRGDVDSFAQEWWVSSYRLTAHAATDAIEASRRVLDDELHRTLTTRKEALIRMHPEPEIGAPRDDIRSHLDKEVKDELEKDKRASGRRLPLPLPRSRDRRK
jgi:hypothetical protein